MKPGLLVSAFLGIGFGAPTACLRANVQRAEGGPSVFPVRLVSQKESIVNGRTQEREFTWDFGRRAIYQVLCAGLTSTSGTRSFRATESRLRVLLHAGTKDSIKATVELHQADAHGNGRTTTVSDIVVPGGLDAIRRTTDKAFAAMGKRLTLLRWRSDAARYEPSGVVVVFR